jgi:hypothetical protein
LRHFFAGKKGQKGNKYALFRAFRLELQSWQPVLATKDHKERKGEISHRGLKRAGQRGRQRGILDGINGIGGLGIRQGKVLATLLLQPWGKHSLADKCVPQLGNEGKGKAGRQGKGSR